MGRRICILILAGFAVIALSVSALAVNSDNFQEVNDDKPGSEKMKKDSIPIYPDLVYEYKIAELNNLTPIELEYNDRVRRYIDVYTIERREHLEKIIGLAELYFPLFEETLDKPCEVIFHSFSFFFRLTFDYFFHISF